MKEPCGDAENMKSDLLKSMQSLLTEFAPSRSENNQKLKTPSCNLEEIFKDKATHFKKLTQEMGHWDSVCTQALTGRFETSKCCECDHTWNVDLKPGVDCQCEGDIENQWQFVKISLQSLLLLDMLVSSELKSKVKVQNKQQHKPNVLGAKDLKIVSGVLQLVLTYGVWPCLLKGIGKPLSNTLPTQLKPVKEENRIKLKVMLQSLLILIKNKEFCSQVLPLCLGDIISGLVQLGYEPLKAIASGNCHPICKHERSWCKEQLNDFIRSSYQPIIIKELMVLQKCAVNSRLSSIKWFLRCLGDHLSCCLMYDNGVINVIIAILDGMPDQVEWIHYDSIGKVISRPPQKLVTPVQYYQKIGPQLLQLLAHKQGNQHHLMISISTICQIYQLHPSMCLANLIDPLVKPLADFHNTEKLTMDSDELISTLASLSNLICTKASIIPEQLMLFLSQLIPILFVVNALEIEPLQTLRSKIKETIATICQKNPTKYVTGLLFQALFNQPSQHSQDETLVINPGLTINLIERISDSTKSCKTHLVCELHTEMKIDCFVELLRNEEMSGHRGDLFVALLQQMIRNVQLTASKEETLSTVSTSGKKEPSKPNTSLLNIDANLNLLKFNIELISTISAMMDSFGHSVLQNTPQIVAFIKSVLDLTQDTKVGISEDSFHENTVDLALMLLSTLLASNKLSNADFESLSTLVPSLDETSRSHGNTSSRAMANDVKTFISTRGSVNANSYTQKPQRGTTENNEDNLTSEKCYTKALDELLDPLLPTRGHALRQLSKLLKHKNAWALKDEEKLFEIFETNLRHNDTYLYLAAVDGLMTLVDVRHDVVLPLLCRRFIEMKTNELDMTASHNRMKLCEAITRSLPICGEILPVYKDLLMNALSCGVLDEDEFIRASSLSGIGELCHLLKFSIGSLIVEVFSCINHVVSTDKSIEVRKAGVQVVALLLKGVDTALLQTIPNELLPIYRWLKLIKISEKDEMTSLHIDNALTILDEIMKELMTPRTLITQINM